MVQSFDVVIVGGRCAGAALGRLTARAGLRTMVVDRAVFPSDTVSTHSISAHGAELLKRWGLFDDVLATGAPNHRSLRVTAPGLDASVPLPDANPGFLAPRRTVLDHLLVDAARSAGAEVWESTTVVGLRWAGDRVIGVTCHGDNRAETAVEAAMVVGADGIRSSVARAVGADTYDVRGSADSGVYAYYDDLAMDEPAVGLRTRRLMLALPTNDGQICVAAAVSDADFPALHRGGDRAVAETAARVSPVIAAALGRGRRASRFVVFRARSGHYRQPWGSGWALVGDAGHYSDPFTAQGIANAFLGADLLATALVDGLGGRRPLPEALTWYHRRRDELTGPIHDVTHRLAGFEWDDDAGLALFLEWRSLVEQLRETVANSDTDGIRLLGA